ncbi:hypothetical protein D3C81_1755580 [compost metagenome]
MGRACPLRTFCQEQGLNRQLHLDILRHIQEGAAVPHCAVQCGKLVLILGYGLHKILLHKITVLTDGCLQIGEQHTLSRSGFGQVRVGHTGIPLDQ